MLIKKYKITRSRTEQICAPLKTEDYVVQPIVDVSPPKWHLGHTTWFFETFVLIPHVGGYKSFNNDFNYVFNSYYETAGARVIRTDRGNLSRPAVEEIYAYRKYVDSAMIQLLEDENKVRELNDLVILGLNHEEQHQELLFTDIKYILGNNPLFPEYSSSYPRLNIQREEHNFVKIGVGEYPVGFAGEGFCFDNELNRHTVYLQPFSISTSLITNADYLEFINDKGYEDFRFWHSDGIEWVRANQIKAPLYWHNIEGEWFNYTYRGLELIDAAEPVTHISYYEAHAFAEWRGMRLPTEFEWEVASAQFKWGQRWEWTESAYLPYPGFTKAPGAIGEYNGKFMVSQMVLRGASEVTSPGHSRNTYRNFFQPNLRWQYTGIRLAK